MKTPLIYDKVLWERSGHWEKFRENMFLIPEGDQTFAIKPMNCPGHMLLFANTLRSYRELPLRYAEAAPLHRNERAGTLHGLTRVRHVTQDDAHIFCTREQIEDEIFGCLDYAKYLYDLFGLERAASSSRPGPTTSSAPTRSGTSPRARCGRRSTGAGSSTRSTEGDGAFYGPKIDLHMTDSLGRAWQMGTIQLDSQQPERLGLPLHRRRQRRAHARTSIHRALFGSLERFIGILTEHYGGAFPFWLAPVQIRVIPVGEQPPRGRARPGRRARRATGSRSTSPTTPSASGSGTPRSRRSRSWSSTATRNRDESLAIRERGGEQSTLSLADFREKLATLEPWQAGAEPSLTS